MNLAGIDHHTIDQSRETTAAHRRQIWRMTRPLPTLENREHSDQVRKVARVVRSLCEARRSSRRLSAHQYCPAHSEPTRQRGLAQKTFRHRSEPPNRSGLPRWPARPRRGSRGTARCADARPLTTQPSRRLLLASDGVISSVPRVYALSQLASDGAAALHVLRKEASTVVVEGEPPHATPGQGRGWG